MKKTIILATACLLTIVTSKNTSAQNLSADDIKAQMIKEWERAKAYSVDYLNTMPLINTLLRR